MVIPDQFRIYETEHWLINHRIDTVLPGYLMVGSTSDSDDLSALADGALESLGVVLANAEKTLKSVVRPARIYVGRFGHSSGNPVHFHLIPIYKWVEDLFWRDHRYRVLAEFGDRSKGKATDDRRRFYHASDRRASRKNAAFGRMNDRLTTEQN